MKKRRKDSIFLKNHLHDGYIVHNFVYVITGLVLTSILILGFSLLGIAINLENNALILGIWSEYIDSDLITEFEDKNNIDIVVVNYDSNENLFQKLKQTQIDIFVPSDYFLTFLLNKNWVEKINYNKLALTRDDFLSEISFQIIQSKDNAETINYGVPYFWGYNSLVFKNQEVLSDVIDIVNLESIKSMDFMFDARITDKYKIGITDDRSFLIPMGLRKLGRNYIKSKSLKDVDEALDALTPYLKNWVITDDVDNYDKFITNQIDIAFNYSGWTNLMLVDEGLDVKQVFLNKSYLWIDFMVINNYSKKKNLAYKFLDFVFQKNNQLDNMREVGDLSVIKNAYNEALSKNIIDGQIDIIKKIRNKELDYPLVSSKSFEIIKRKYDEFRAK